MAPDHRDRTAAAPMLRRFTDLRRYTIGATDGDIGSVDDLYFDDLAWTVRYLVAGTGTWLSGRKVLLSPAALRGFDPAGQRVRTDLTRRQVEGSPSIDTQKPVSGSTRPTSSRTGATRRTGRVRIAGVRRRIRIRWPASR